MCGIAGIYSFEKPLSGGDKTICSRMLHSLHHRGPDSEGLYQAEKVIFGHRRLSILDLSSAAHQPICNENETLWLVYNGEIYNYRQLRDELIGKGHRFKSKTDSEVILHLYEEYGTDCLTHLRGMFAFALWDETKGQLFLARDRIGIKPLYYFQDSSSLIFASEVRAIRAADLMPLDVNFESAVQFLQFGSIPEPSTTFEQIHSLAAGHFLIANSDGVFVKRYWSLVEVLLRDQTKLISGKTIRSMLQETVQQHLLSDVPVGILLSGGMDSSSLVALAQQSSCKLHTLTISFEESNYDESEFARLVSQKFNTQHHECRVTSQLVLEHLDDFFDAMDQPTIDGLNTFWVSKLAKGEGLKVLLSGLGGDEVFGGYPYFKYAHRLLFLLPYLKQMPLFLRSWFLKGFSEFGKGIGLLGANRLQFLMEPTLPNVYRVYRGLFAPDVLNRLFPDHLEVLDSSLDSQLHFMSHKEKVTYLECDRYLKNQLLRDTDVMGMSQSVEIRVPFLDHVFVESLLGQKLERNESKRLLKEALKDDLPPEIQNRKKAGFIFPMADWLTSTLKSCVEEVLLDRNDGIPLNQSEVEKIWRQFLRGEIHWSQPWSLFVLKRWHNEVSSLISDHVS